MSAMDEAKPSDELIEIMRKVAPPGPPPTKVEEVGPASSYVEEWEWSDGTVGQPEIPGWVEDTDPYYGDSLEIGPIEEEDEDEPVIVDDTADLLAQAAAARKRFGGS